MSHTSVFISSHVIESIRALPDTDRQAVAMALVNEMLLGLNPDDSLTPFQAMLYSIIQFHVRRDSARSVETARVNAM